MWSRTFDRSAGTAPAAAPTECSSGAYGAASSAAAAAPPPPSEYPVYTTGVSAPSVEPGRRWAARAASSTAWPIDFRSTYGCRPGVPSPS